MGDINFTIAKDVNLNKVVNLDIDKNVNVEVNNDDILATAEADAEAFGERALAETDAFTYVSGEGDGEIVESPGQVDAVGNAELSLSGDPLGDNVIQVGDQLTVNHVDVDDINGFDHFAPLSSPPPDTPDALLPDPLFSIEDKLINIVAEVPDVEGEFRGELAEDVTISFGERTLDTLLNPGPAELTVTIEAGTEYLVEQLFDVDGNPIPGDFEVEFAGTPGDVTVEFGGLPLDIEEIAYTQTSAGIGAVGEWNFDVVANIIEGSQGGGNGEAFSYAESTAALDLNGGGVEPL